MEVGLAGVLTTNPANLANVSQMEKKLHIIDDARYEYFINQQLALTCRIAPWATGGLLNDSADGMVWVLIGNARIGHHRIGVDEIARIYRKQGLSFINSLSGTYALLMWEESTKRLTLVMDRLATQKLYVFRKDDLLLFSTELAALLAHPLAPRKIDPIALAQFLITSHLVDERSLILGINVCKPATITTWAQQGESSHIYWQPRIGDGEDDGLDAWADRLTEVLQPAVQSASNSSSLLLLPVTGGLDSRAIAAFLPSDTKDKLQCLTFGHRHSHDVRYARKVTQALSVHHQYLPLSNTFFRDYLPYATSLADGEISIEALPMLRLLNAAPRGSALLSGYLGDTLSGSNLPDLNGLPNARDRFEITWKKLFQKKGFADTHLRAILLPELYAEIKDSLRDYAHDLYNRVEAPSATEKLIAIKLATRQWRYTSYMGRIMGSQFRFEAPFLDTDVLDTFLSMPLPYRLHQRAYRRMLVRHAPHLARIPEMKTHRPVTYTDRLGSPPIKAKHQSIISNIHLKTDWQLNRIQKQIEQYIINLSGGWLGPHDRDQYAHHDESIRSVDPSWFREKLNQVGLIENWFDKAALNQMMDEHLACKMDHSIRINNVVAFLAWRGFIGIQD